ncbi:GNAT family N-acetyltransferase [Streptomyces sp. NBC_00525]|uniref:GNAT family N-acetyltransferase n=1 Tax=Streptomyces sp. NBC_00525 TaxID=2903660 RepID=UPI002E80A111|nr:GNAT family N-acetyltransferase [Streptomyces sp. NBC_00525]WUC97486.1 GNAT family N-acetyltransferase [Streptomyces sp. NBC_00525]
MAEPTTRDQDFTPWPPAPINTARLVLRESEPRDRAAFVELLSSPEVHTYLGGPRPREACEQSLPEAPGRRPGCFVIDLDGEMIGLIELKHRDLTTPDAVRPDLGRTELGYLLLPKAWGNGYATEACEAALSYLPPTTPVVLITQTANTPSMRLATKLGFTEAHRFEAWNAQQWLGVRKAAREVPVCPEGDAAPVRTG